MTATLHSADSSPGHDDFSRAGADLVGLTKSALNLAQIVDHVHAPEAGAIDVFMGITRAQHDAALGALLRLEYAAYEEMALAKTRQLLVLARERWPICRIGLAHRLGPVCVGGASVIIAVSTGHREAAFRSCQFLIDSVKTTLPIWKNDIFERGTRWQTGQMIQAQGQ